MYAEETDKQLYRFAYSACAGISAAPKARNDRKQAEQDMLACIEGIEEEQGTLIFIDEIFVYVNHAYTSCPAEIYLSGPMPKYSFVRGGFPTEEMLSSGIRYVVLGDGRKHETYKRSGKDYILIQGEEYEVTGYVSAPNSGILSDTILLFYDCVSDNIVDSLCEYYLGENFVVNYMSDTNPEAETLMMDHLYTLVGDSKSEYDYILESDTYYFITSSGADKNYFSNAEHVLRYKSFANLIYMFCIIMIMFVLWLWMTQRKEEFAIRKEFGYSPFKLSVMVLIEIVELLFVAALLAELVIAAIAFAGKELYVLEIGNVYSRFLRQANFICISLILVGAIPFIKLYIEKPAVLLNRGKK